jgi:hypothetical protein
VFVGLPELAVRESVHHVERPGQPRLPAPPRSLRHPDKWGA